MVGEMTFFNGERDRGVLAPRSLSLSLSFSFLALSFSFRVLLPLPLPAEAALLVLWPPLTMLL